MFTVRQMEALWARGDLGFEKDWAFWRFEQSLSAEDAFVRVREVREGDDRRWEWRHSCAESPTGSRRVRRRYPRASSDDERRTQRTHCPARHVDRPATACSSCGHLPRPMQNTE